MATGAQDLYPLSSQDGQAIPYEVMEGLGLRIYNLTANNTTNGVIPATWGLVYLYATADCVLRNDATPLPDGPALLAENTTYDRTFFIPAGAVIMALLNPTVVSIKSLGLPGYLLINSVRRWAGMNQAQQSALQ